MHKIIIIGGYADINILEQEVNANLKRLHDKGFPVTNISHSTAASGNTAVTTVMIQYTELTF